MNNYVKQIEFNAQTITGMKLTIIGVSDWMATTTRHELEIIKVIKEPYAQYPETQLMEVKLRGKRKTNHIRLSYSDLILKDWNLGIKIDTDFNSFCGNALINLVGNKQEIKELIDLHYITGEKGIIVISKDENTSDESKEPLYPIRSEEIRQNHYVLNRILTNKEEEIKNGI